MKYSKESFRIFSGNLDASLNGDDDDDFMGLEEFDPTVEVYECDTDRWRYLSPLPNGAGRSQHAATSINDSKVSNGFFLIIVYSKEVWQALDHWL